MTWGRWSLAGSRALTGFLTMQFNTFAKQWIWKGLEEPILKHIFDSGEVLDVEPGFAIMDEGDDPLDFFIVLRGDCEVYLPDSPRRVSQVSLARLGEGESFGEYTYFDKQPVSASVRAVTPVSLFRISHDALDQLILRDPAAGLVIYRNILMSLVRRLRKQNEELDLFSLPTDDEG